MTETIAVAVEPAAGLARFSYRPSGHVEWGQFLPLAVGGLIVSAFMAWVMAWTEMRAYYLVLSPLILGLPVITMIVLSIYFGRCRNVHLGIGYAALLITIFYAGFWLVSYYNFMTVSGAGGAQFIHLLTGTNGLPGYFLLRCGAGVITGTRGEIVMLIGIIARGLEFGCVLACALYIARQIAGRVYFEDYARWASSRVFGFHSAQLSLVLEAVESEDWSLLEKVDKVTLTRDQRLRGFKMCRAEYLPGSIDQPLYITIEGARLPRSLCIVFPFLIRLTKRQMRQRYVSAESAHRLKNYFGGLTLGSPTQTASIQQAGPPSATIGYWSQDPAINPRISAGLTSMATDLCLGGTTLVGKGVDFRAEAAEKSIEIILGHPDASPDRIESSLCYPGDLKPLGKLKVVSVWHLSLCLIFLAGMIFGNILIFAAPAFGNFQIAFGCAILCFAIGVASFTILLFIFDPIVLAVLMKGFRKREHNLLTANNERLPRRLIRIEDFKTFHISKVTPEDWGVLLIDAQNHRLLVEGICFRYVIRACDVTALEPARSSSSVAARVDYQIYNTPLSIVIIRQGMGNSIIAGLAIYPVIGWIVRWLGGQPSVRFTNKLRSAMGLPL